MTSSERTTFGPEAAKSILRRACAIAEVEPDGIELLRLGDHAVFRIDGGRTIARVGRGPERLPSVRREVRVAAWLAAERYPAARLVTTAEQPVVVDGHPVTFWEGLADGDTYATTGEMGKLLRRLHELEAPDFDLPALRPFEKVRDRLEQAQISGDSRAYLLSLAEELEGDYSHLDFALPAGPVHGDFNVGNVLHDDAGKPKVIDLDGFAIGPREWDLMQTAMYYDSFGWHSETEYADFVAGYGWDVRTWNDYGVMRSIRELLMITWLSQNAATDPRAAKEFEKRVKSLISGGSRRDWAPS